VKTAETGSGGAGKKPSATTTKRREKNGEKSLPIQEEKKNYPKRADNGQPTLPARKKTSDEWGRPPQEVVSNPMQSFAPPSRGCKPPETPTGLKEKRGPKLKRCIQEDAPFQFIKKPWGKKENFCVKSDPTTKKKRREKNAKSLLTLPQRKGSKKGKPASTRAKIREKEDRRKIHPVGKEKKRIST